MVKAKDNEGMAKKAKHLSEKDALELGEAGAFALHLSALLRKAKWTSTQFADKCQAAGIDVNEWQVRAWLRGDNMPRAGFLRPLGKVLKLKDIRHILPK